MTEKLEIRDCDGAAAQDIRRYFGLEKPGCVVDSEEIIARHMAPEREQARRMREALTKLANEAHGFVSMSEPERHGWTNIHVLEDRIAEAKRALAEEL